VVGIRAGRPGHVLHDKHPTADTRTSRSDVAGSGGAYDTDPASTGWTGCIASSSPLTSARDRPITFGGLPLRS
jgi:hypothetical protein